MGTVVVDVPGVVVSVGGEVGLDYFEVEIDRCLRFRAMAESCEENHNNDWVDRYREGS